MDTLCQHVKAFVIHKRVPSNPYYARIVKLYGHKSILGEDTLLYLIDGRDKQVFAKRLWVPQTMRILILANLYGSSLGGHWGPEITLQNILTSYFWPSLASDAETFICRCPDCYINADRKATRTRVPLKSWPTATRRNARVHVDLVSPLHSVTNNVFVLTLTLLGLTSYFYTKA